MLLLLPIFSLLPDFTYKFLQKNFWPTPTETIIEQLNKKVISRAQTYHVVNRSQSGMKQSNMNEEEVIDEKDYNSKDGIIY
jgi:hypothetical protein